MISFAMTGKRVASHTVLSQIIKGYTSSTCHHQLVLHLIQPLPTIVRFWPLLLLHL
jgi:hypothetical protein